MQVIPYLNLQGRAQEAVTFYQEQLGAEVEMLMRFKDMPPSEDGSQSIPAGLDEQIMHATLMFGNSPLMLSDSPDPGQPEFKGISLYLAVDSVEKATQLFEVLAESGNVVMPIAKTFWAELFGMVDDQFGVNWMISVEASDC